MFPAADRETAAVIDTMLYREMFGDEPTIAKTLTTHDEASGFETVYVALIQKD